MDVDRLMLSRMNIDQNIIYNTKIVQQKKAHQPNNSNIKHHIIQIIETLQQTSIGPHW